MNQLTGAVRAGYLFVPRMSVRRAGSLWLRCVSLLLVIIMVKLHIDRLWSLMIQQWQLVR